MNQISSIAVLKFGGTSVASAEMREYARHHVALARNAGEDVVCVVSAQGRSGAPYATDTLLSLVGGTLGDATTDLAIACGESLSAAIFAHELTQSGIASVALTGAQAGIITDNTFGDAKILRVDPQAVRDALSGGFVVVVAGFQGVSESGATTTLGRGGSDLSAIALGAALQANRVDVYTDVPGAMTADPRRIETAKTISNATHEEMSELAELGAKVMHEKAAKYALQTATRYGIRDIRTGVGTTIDERIADSAHPVTGVTVAGPITWVRIIRGDLDRPSRRMELELEMFRRLAQDRVSIDQVSVNQSGVSFVVDGERGDEVRKLLGDLNLAVRARDGCAKLSVVGAGMRGTPGVIHRIVNVLSDENVEIVHLTDSNITISILVPHEDAARAERALHDHFHLESGA